MRRTLLAALALLPLGCLSTPVRAPRSAVSVRPARVRELPPEATYPSAAAPTYTAAATTPTTPAPRAWRDSHDVLVESLSLASPGGRRVLDTARAMIDDGVIVRGSCYTWLNAVYTRAGGHHRVIYTGPRREPFTAFEVLSPGDWVFFINHSFGDVTHSAIFIAWEDPANHIALMASYPGSNRRDPGRLSSYELTNVYQIVRMVDGAPAPPPPPRTRARRTR